MARDKQKYENHAVSEEESRVGKVRKSEKVILEVREGNKLMKEVKIEGQTRVKSPDKKVEEKKEKFIKFEPKKARAEATVGMVNILKTSTNL